LTAASAAAPAVIGPLRTFAATAAIAVALTHLLPEAVSELGVPGLIAFAVGLLIPSVLHGVEALAAHTQRGSPAGLALEAGFLGLLLHHVGDGLGVGAYAALPGGVLQHLDVVLALLAHTVPLVAAVTLAYRKRYGLSSALVRAAALALCSMLGVALSFAIPGDSLAEASAWIGALLSGVLLHVVRHDWHEDLPSSEGARFVDLLAGTLGFSLALLGHHDAEHPGLEHAFFAALATLASRTAPWLLLGLSLCALLRRLAGTQLLELDSRFHARREWRMARELWPALGVVGVCLGVGVFGLLWGAVAASALVIAPLLAGGAARVVELLMSDPEARAARSSEAIEVNAADGLEQASSASAASSLLGDFDRAASLWLAGVAAGAVLDVSLPDGALFSWLGTGRELLSAGALGVLLASGSTIVIALGVLSGKGLSIGAALILAGLSSALGLSKLIQLWRRYDALATFVLLLWFAGFYGVLAVLLNRLHMPPRPLLLPEFVGGGAAMLLSLLAVVRAERIGLRALLRVWGPFEHRPHYSTAIPNGSAATMRSPEASGPRAEA
jgi:hypothetical protein